MHPARDHHLPPDPDAYRHAPASQGPDHRHRPDPRRLRDDRAGPRTAPRHPARAGARRGDPCTRRRRARASASWPGPAPARRSAIRPIAEAILDEPLAVGVVNREREATPETPVLERRDRHHRYRAALVPGRPHHRPGHRGRRRDPPDLGRARALSGAGEAGRLPVHLAQRHGGSVVLRALPRQRGRARDAGVRSRTQGQGPGAAPDSPTSSSTSATSATSSRNSVASRSSCRPAPRWSALARELGEQWKRLTTAFYHGGEPIRVIRPFLEGEVERPFLLAMTAAGQSALNVRGLDTVVIYDARYGNVVERGRNVLHRLYLGANEILQMAGRVHGRVPNGEVVILSDRDLAFERLRPTPPEFQLAGDAERVAITCAALGVDARRPGPARSRSTARRIGGPSSSSPSAGWSRTGGSRAYGREVEAMPVERPWGELLVHADPDLMPMVAVCSNIDSLHRMTREERDLHGVVVNGSDHLTAYNLYAEAVNQHGYLGEVYGLPRHLFEDGSGRLGRATRRAGEGDRGRGARRGVGLPRRSSCPLPKQLPYAAKELRRAWADLLAPHHAVRPGHRRAHRRRPGGAGLEDLGRGELGRGGRDPSVSSPTGSGCRARRSRAPRCPTIWFASTPSLARRRSCLSRAPQAPGARGRAAALVLRLRARYRDGADSRPDSRRAPPSRARRAGRTP